MRRILQITVAVVVVAACYGAWFFLDARPERGSSWPVYLALSFVVGLVALCAEGAAAIITKSDKVTDPLPKRAFRLLLLLASAAFFMALLYAALDIM